MSTFKELYKNEISDSLMKKFNYTSKMEIPKLEKIVINMGVGEAAHDSKFIEAAVKDLEVIAGQKPVVTKARKSIAGFKLIEGQTFELPYYENNALWFKLNEKQMNVFEKAIKVEEQEVILKEFMEEVINYPEALKVKA